MTDPTPRFLMPGDTHRELGTTDVLSVIASTWYIDDPGRTPEILVLFLRPDQPYYEVAHLEARAGSWHIFSSKRFDNIGPAVVDGYAQEGGDW